MSDSKRRAFKPLRLRLSELEDDKIKSALELRYEELQVQRELAVASARKSAIADRKRQIDAANAEISFILLMQEAAEQFPAIAREPVWAAYRESGELIFECPFSEGDMRNAMKVQRASLEQQARQVDENGGEEGLYRGDDAPQE